eukprot:TRINITY_DN3524_c0_g1_i1.p1 TRINITY_DN3524_c0_g1~~TRINITY_DN3524_c0_g1_i1.p1  ORF type:complete len:2090 (+),score=557.56 TRINITY_DN3524_c0_g1_i1:69-6338(+)
MAGMPAVAQRLPRQQRPAARLAPQDDGSPQLLLPPVLHGGARSWAESRRQARRRHPSAASRRSRHPSAASRRVVPSLPSCSHRPAAAPGSSGAPSPPTSPGRSARRLVSLPSAARARPAAAPVPRPCDRPPEPAVATRALHGLLAVKTTPLEPRPDPGAADPEGFAMEGLAELRRIGEGGKVAMLAAQARQLAVIRRRFAAAVACPAPAAHSASPAAARRGSGAPAHTVDLAGIGVTDTDMVVIAAMLRACAQPTILDLRDNAQLTDGRLLLGAVRANRWVEMVLLDGCCISGGLAEAVRALCEERYAERARGCARRRRRRQKLWERRREQGLRDELVRLADVEAGERHMTRAAWLHQWQQLAAGCAAACGATERREQRNALRRRHIQRRLELGDEETAARHGQEGTEWVGRLLLCENGWELGGRLDVTVEQLNSRSCLKRLEHSGWIVARRAEKARLADEARRRAAQEDEETAARQQLTVQHRHHLDVLAVDAAASKEEWLAKQTAREAAEIKAEYLRQQELQRLEKERAWKIEKENRERLRKEQERAKQRERCATSETKARNLVRDREELLRDMLEQIRDIDMRVARAREGVNAAERFRSASYSLPPRLELAAKPAMLIHFLGDCCKPTPCLGECTVQEEVCVPQGSKYSWKEIDKRAQEARRVLRLELQEAARALKTRGRELSLALFPTGLPMSSTKAPAASSSAAACPVGSPVPPQGATGKAQTRQARADRRRLVPELFDAAWLRAVDCALETGSGAAVWYDPAKPPAEGAAADCPLGSDARDRKLQILGGSIRAWVGPRTDGAWPPPPATEAECGTDHLISPHASGSLPGAVSIEIHQGASLGEVGGMLSALRYEDTREERGCIEERLLYIQVSLRHPVLLDTAVDRYGVIVRGAGCLAAVCTTECSAVVPMVLGPPLIYIPPEHRTVIFEEDTPADKVCIVPEVQLVDPHVLISSPTGQLILRKSMNPSDPTYSQGRLAVRIVEGYTPDDQIVLRRLFDDDIGVIGSGTERRFTHGYRGDGIVFARLVEGTLPTHKEVTDRGDFGGEAPPGAGPGFAMEFTGEDIRSDRLVKLLKRLRFANFSNNPSADTRTVEIQVTAPGDPCQTSRALVYINVVPSDDPTQFELAATRLMYRYQGPSSIPDSMRHHLRHSCLPLFHNACVADPDTDRFSGGSLTVISAAPLCRGDTIFVRSDPDNGGVYVGVAGSNGQAELYFEGRHVGRIYVGGRPPPPPRQPKDEVATPQAQPSPSPLKRAVSGIPNSSLSSTSTPGTSPKDMPGLEWFRAAPGAPQTAEVVFHCVFQSDGAPSISMLQSLVRSICFTNTLFAPPESWRSFEVVLRIGPSCWEDGQLKDNSESEAQELRGRVEMRITGPLFDVQTRRFDYREGSGAVRIAPVEMPSDQRNFVEQGWADGFVLVDIIEGDTKEDLLSVRTGGGRSDDLRVVLRDADTPEQIPHFDAYGFRMQPAPREAADDSEREDSRPQLHVSPQAGPDVVLQEQAASEPAREGTSASDSGNDGGDAFSKASALRHGSLWGSRLGMAAQVSPHLSFRRQREESNPSEETPEHAAQQTSSPVSLKDRLRDKAAFLVAERRAQRASLMEVARKGLIQAAHQAKFGNDECNLKAKQAGKTTSSELFFGMQQTPVGVLLIAPGQLFIRFTRRPVSRKEVLNCLRSLTYNNVSSDPEILRKLVRITVKDSGPVATQALIEVTIQSVDDVTKVLLDEPRRKYRPFSLSMQNFGCWPIAGLRKARLEDPDTEFFDGGSLHIDIVGGQKGDCLSFMTVEQQRLVRRAADEYYALQQSGQGAAMTLSGDTPAWQGDVFPGELMIRGKDIVSSIDGLVVGHLELPQTKGQGGNNVRVSFRAHDPPRVTILVASYVLNCISFSNTADKVPTGQRTFNVRIRDAANPAEGKAKIYADVCKPTITIPPGPQAFLRQTTSGEPVWPFDRASACIAEHKPQAVLQHGFVQAAVIDGFQTGDQLLFCPRDASQSVGAAAQGPAVTITDNSASLGMEFLGKFTEQLPHLHRLEMNWASKMGNKALQLLVNAVQVRCASPGTRVVELVVHDGFTDATCIRVTIKVKK